MSLLALGTVKGSPGVTTAAVALGACWPADRVVVVEADPAGGDLAARFGLAPEPGLVSLATATRRAPVADALWSHTQNLPGDLSIVIGPASAKQSRAALAMLVPAVGAGWSALGADVLVDCGRLDPSSPALDLLARADLSVVVIRPQLTDLHHAAARLADLRSRSRDLKLLLAGPGPYGADEVADAVGAEVVGALPWDPVGAALLAGAPGSRRGLTRTSLVRAARQLAELLAAQLRAPQLVTDDAVAMRATSDNGDRSKAVTR